MFTALDYFERVFSVAVNEPMLLIEAARHGMHTVSVPIMARYADDRRASHFKPFRDVSKITGMISWRLIRGGMMLPSLWRSCTRSPVIGSEV